MRRSSGKTRRISRSIGLAWQTSSSKGTILTSFSNSSTVPPSRHAEAGRRCWKWWGSRPDVQRICQASRPFELLADGWPFLFKTADPALERTLAKESSWYACLYDGDGSL